jgi:hypothetical protein
MNQLSRGNVRPTTSIPAAFEQASRRAFNKSQGTSTQKSIVSVAGKQHEFDLYEPGVIAGGINSSTWRTRTGKNNTGGQDRVTAELLWLHLCTSVKRKVLILRDRDMAEGIKHRFGGVNFFSPPIEIWLYDTGADTITHYGDL